MASVANEVKSPVSEKIIKGHGQQLEGYPHNSHTANGGIFAESAAKLWTAYGL
jgi:hypothetical protein